LSRAATQSQRRWPGKAPQSRDTPRYKLAMARQSPSPWKGRLTPQSAPQGWPPKRRREGWQRGASASETIVRRQRRLGVSPGSIPLPKFRTSTKTNAGTKPGVFASEQEAEGRKPSRLAMANSSSPASCSTCSISARPYSRCSSRRRSTCSICIRRTTSLQSSSRFTLVAVAFFWPPRVAV
jgi:hypothetical protein